MPRQPQKHREPRVQCPRVDAGRPIRESVRQDRGTQKGYRLIVDLSGQVLRFRVPKVDIARESLRDLHSGDTMVVTARQARLMSGDRELARVGRGRLLHVKEVRNPWIKTAVLQEGTRKAGWIRIRDVQLHSAEGRLYPTPAQISRAQFASAGLLVLKSKVFDDGLYAAVELAAQEGAGKFAGKKSLLRSLADHLAQGGPQTLGRPEQIVLGGAKLGGIDLALPRNLLRGVDSRIDAFLDDPLRSKPLGFYTWSDDLSTIFRQDRMLQTRLLDNRSPSGGPSLGRLLAALHGHSESRATYAAYLDLVPRLTNPMARADLRGLLEAMDEGRAIQPPKEVSFFPPSRSRETDLIKQLYGNRLIPDGFNLADELVERIRDGRLDLAPDEDSGWYDYQTWALEPMVVPERMPEWKHARMDDRYRDKLVELFKGAYALARETHIKQLESPDVAAAEPGFQEPKLKIFVPLELSGEPLPTYYLRRAESYRFVRNVLEKTFGGESLGQMHRLTRDGPASKSLDEELRWMEGLFRGAYTTVARQLGMAAPADAEHDGRGDPEADAGLFLDWTANLALDPDLGRDVRMMVPLFYDLARKRTKVWAMFGWQWYRLHVSYVRRPAVRVLDLAGNTLPPSRYDLSFGGQSEEVIVPVTAEFYVDRPLNREEFRQLVDTYGTRSAVLENLTPED